MASRLNTISDHLAATYIQTGANIKHARSRVNMDRETLARKSGYSYAHLTQIENGKTRINLENLLRISLVLGVSLRALVP